MPSGIRATVEFTVPDVCSIAQLSAEAGTTIDAVTTSVSLPDDGGSVTEFFLDADHGSGDGLGPTASFGSTDLYQVSHDGPVSCPCECLGQFDCPVERYFAREGVLQVVFYATDYDQLQAVVGDLRERFPEVDIQRLVRSPTDGSARDGVFVDRGKLTERQFEVLQTAFEMGYFERPRRSNATEVAAALDITQSTFTEHLSAAQSKLVGDVLEGGG